MEYLLWSGDGTNACRDTSTINSQGTWQALGTDEIAKRRIAYARVIVDDVAARLGSLVKRWEPTGGDFVGELSRAGSGSRYYGSQQVAFNSIMDALFYLDKDLKDAKLGGPLGVSTTATPLEAPYSKLGRAHVQANVAGFRSMFFGCGADKALGLDDLLEGVGAARIAQTAQTMLAEIDAAIAAIPDGHFEDELGAKSAAAKALYDALRKLGALLRTEVITVLDLELPSRVEGDND